MTSVFYLPGYVTLYPDPDVTVLGRPSFRGARASNPSLSANRTQPANAVLAMSYLAESWHKVNSLS